MLQIYNSLSGQVGEGGSTHEVPSLPEPSLADLFSKAIGFIRRRFLVILSVVPLTLGLAAFYILTTPPLYSAHARIIIDAGKVQLFKQAILDDPVNSVMVDSQLEILRSDNFLLSIVKNLQLTKDPEFVASKRGLMGSAIDLILYRLHLLLHPSAANISESDVTQAILRAFRNRLTTNRVGLTYIIEIGFESSHPDYAAKIANAVADAFIVDQLESKYQTIGKATAWLQDRLNELRAQASAAERAVVEYKTKNNIVDTGGRLVNEQQVAELTTALVKARADTVEAQARLDRVSQVVRSDDLDPASTEMATVTETLNNQVITKLREQYLELRQREALLSSRLGSNHLAVVNLRNQVHEIHRNIVDQMKQIAEAYKSDYNIAKARENSLEKSLASSVAGSQTANKAQIELRQLESAAQSYRALYDNFQQRYTDSVQQQSFPMSEVRVISSASPPSEKSSPKSFRVLAVGIVGGLVLGFGIATLLEISDRVFRTSRQVEAKLQAECIGMVPMIKPSVQAAAVKNKATADPAGSRIIAPNVGLLRHVVDLPLSPFAESIRAVKVGADLSRVTKSNKVIGITSAIPGEGKSTIAASLAQISAHGGARTILVDCDLRKPSLSPELARNATAGLVEVVAGMVGLDDVIWSDPATQLSFLPAVVRSRMTHTSEILASDAMRRLFERLRESYDYVIVDLPPLTPVVDVRSATHLLDCYVFVVEWGKTKIGVVEHAITTARRVYDNLLGVVLNKVDFDRLRNYDGTGSQPYYYSYYTHYGYTD